MAVSLEPAVRVGDGGRGGGREVLRRTRDHLVFLAQHHLLQEHEIGERTQVLEPLALELGEPLSASESPKKR